MLAATTGATAMRQCGTCGASVEHYESQLASGHRFWMPDRHRAPCGATCIGGGVPMALIRQGSQVHRAKRCDVAGCHGGQLP